jgi:hypothetical protein
MEMVESSKRDQRKNRDDYQIARREQFPIDHDGPPLNRGLFVHGFGKRFDANGRYDGDDANSNEVRKIDIQHGKNSRKENDLMVIFLLSGRCVNTGENKKSRKMKLFIKATYA